MVPCKYTGTIPAELAGGEYVRNGGNPVANADLGRDAHWFDGDGMLSGVSFRRDQNHGIQPEFVNQYILTDLFLSSISIPSLRKPIVPSIATLVNPLSTLLQLCLAVMRTILLVLLSRLPGSVHTIKRISVANTAIIYHNGRALATCESGPPMRVVLPSLETVGWYNGKTAEGEPNGQEVDGEALGGYGLLSFMKEWTTAHPKVDPSTNEMILFHSMFAPPYVQYSILPANVEKKPALSRMINAPVSGIQAPKMMHDFGVSHNHTVIMDLPLFLDPTQLLRNRPTIRYEPDLPSRFGVFPRRAPSSVRFFETKACCIFHTANTWDICDKAGKIESVDMLACRLTSATLVYSAGNINGPQPKQKRSISVDANPNPSYDKGPALESPTDERPSFFSDFHQEDEEEQCRLYYYSFNMTSPLHQNTINHQFALSAVPFEFPSVRPDREMSSARFVYGCTTTSSSFNSALGRVAKIDGLVKFNAQALIARGKANPPPSITGCVDTRSAVEILASDDVRDAIQIFQTPGRLYAQEPRFVPSASGVSEDDGFLLSYMFDEAQLGHDGQLGSSAFSELWIIDAKSMKNVLAKVQLPQRVPYGLHGSWFSEMQVLGQRPIDSVRKSRDVEAESTTCAKRLGERLINGMVKAIGG